MSKAHSCKDNKDKVPIVVKAYSWKCAFYKDRNKFSLQNICLNFKTNELGGGTTEETVPIQLLQL